MTEIFSWAETAAGLLANDGYHPEDRAVELAAKEAERVQARAAFDAAVASDPAWSASRKLQEALAARGWTGRWVEVGRSRPAELEPLFTARTAAQSRQGMWGPDGSGGMEPVNDVARDIEQAASERYEAAQLRLRAQNAGLPPGLEGL